MKEIAKHRLDSGEVIRTSSASRACGSFRRWACGVRVPFTQHPVMWFRSMAFEIMKVQCLKNTRDLRAR
jgi:hypothetical protein